MADPDAVLTRAHEVSAAVLAAVIVPEPFGRRRRAAGYAEYVRHQQKADAVMRRLAPALSVLTMLTGAGAAVAVWPRDRPAAAWRLGSVAAVGAAVALTVRVHVPINGRLRTWSPQASPAARPADWAQARQRWEAAHVVRRALVVVAGGCVLAGRWSS